MPDHSEISKQDLFLAGHIFKIDGRTYRIDPQGLSSSISSNLHTIYQQAYVSELFEYFGLVEDVNETGFTWSRKIFGTEAKLRVLFERAEFISQQAETPINA